jgi:hypothetical protein
MQNSLRCWIGFHDWTTVSSQQCDVTISGLATLFKPVEQAAVAVLRRCKRCSRRKATIETLSGRVQTVHPSLISLGLCDECDEPNSWLQSASYWPTTPGVPDDATYCQNCWNMVDQDMREEGYGPSHPEHDAGYLA